MEPSFCKISPILIRSHKHAHQELHPVKSLKSQNAYEDTRVSFIFLCPSEFPQQWSYLFSSNVEIFLLFMNKLMAAEDCHIQQGPQAAHEK